MPRNYRHLTQEDAEGHVETTTDIMARIKKENDGRVAQEVEDKHQGRSRNGYDKGG
jgi:hypothetical protein